MIQDDSRFWPGLGGTDTDYAWALVCYPLFEAVTMPIAAVMAHRFPFTILMLFPLFPFAIGGIMYALAVNVWMVFIAHSLIGVGAASAAVVHTYIGEMGTVMDDIRMKQGKKPRKYTLYIAFSFILNGGYLVVFGK